MRNNFCFRVATGEVDSEASALHARSVGVASFTVGSL